MMPFQISLLVVDEDYDTDERLFAATKDCTILTGVYGVDLLLGAITLNNINNCWA